MRRFAFLVLLASQLLASARYGLMVDPDMSPYASAEDLILANRGVVWAADAIRLKSCSPGPGGGILRFLELGLLWYPLERYTMVVQHEIFGHGYRIRSLGANIAQTVGYQIDVPFPYGPGGGATAFYVTDQITTNQREAISIGGSEGTAVLALELKKKWLAEGCIDGRMAFLYWDTQQDLTDYMFGTSSADDPSSGHDMNAYIYWLNATYPTGHMTPAGLRGKAWVNYIDPMSWYALWALGRYIWSGCPVPIPMIDIGSWGLLPNLRVALSPFCPEWYLELFAVHKQCQVHYFYARAGQFAGNHTYGLGWECKRLLWYQKKYSVGFRVDGWIQPAFSPYLASTYAANIPASPVALGQQAGCNLWLVAAAPLCGPLELEATVGYKTSGFMQGESLSSAPIARLGLFGRF